MLASRMRAAAQVVSLDSLMALVALTCVGSMEDRMHLAFWVLDRCVLRSALMPCTHACFSP